MTTHRLAFRSDLNLGFHGTMKKMANEIRHAEARRSIRLAYARNGLDGRPTGKPVCRSCGCRCTYCVEKEVHERRKSGEID